MIRLLDHIVCRVAGWLLVNCSPTPDARCRHSYHWDSSGSLVCFYCGDGAA